MGPGRQLPGDCELNRDSEVCTVLKDIEVLKV